MLAEVVLANPSELLQSTPLTTDMFAMYMYVSEYRGGGTQKRSKP